MKRMFWSCCVLGFLFLLDEVYCDVSKSRVRRQDPGAQNGQLIDNIFNIPITAIKQTAAAAQVFSPENTQTIDTVLKIPVSTLEAVGSLVKATTERRQNAENIQRIRQDRRDRLSAIKEQKRKRKEELLNQRLMQQQLKRVVRHYKDPLGLNAWKNVLFGHHSIIGGHHAGGLLGGHHSGLGSGHGIHGILGSHGALLGNRPQHTYAVHEDINEDTSFSWHGLTAGFGTYSGSRPSSSAVKIENKIAPKEKKQKDFFKYPSDDVSPQNKIAKKNKSTREDDDPPIENKIAPRNGRVTFV